MTDFYQSRRRQLTTNVSNCLHQGTCLCSTIPRKPKTERQRAFSLTSFVSRFFLVYREPKHEKACGGVIGRPDPQAHALRSMSLSLGGCTSAEPLASCSSVAKVILSFQTTKYLCLKIKNPTKFCSIRKLLPTFATDSHSCSRLEKSQVISTLTLQC